MLSCKSMLTFWIPHEWPPHHLFRPPPMIGAHALTKDVHNYDEWKRDLCHAIVLDCNEQWSWDFMRVLIVPECLFWPAKWPLCPDLGFWFRGQQHLESHQVPDLGSVSDPWDVPLSTSMPHDVLWSYLAFWVISVSDIKLFLPFPCSMTPELLSFLYCMW